MKEPSQRDVTVLRNDHSISQSLSTEGFGKADRGWFDLFGISQVAAPRITIMSQH